MTGITGKLVCFGLNVLEGRLKYRRESTVTGIIYCDLRFEFSCTPKGSFLLLVIFKCVSCGSISMVPKRNCASEKD